MSLYIVRVWCRDCFDIDPDGCFDGADAYLGDDHCVDRGRDDAFRFLDRESAERAADDLMDGAPWDYEIEEVTR